MPTKIDIMNSLFKGHSNTQRAVINKGKKTEYVEIKSKRNINAGEGKVGRIIRFEDGTAIRVTYEIVE